MPTQKSSHLRITYPLRIHTNNFLWCIHCALRQKKKKKLFSYKLFIVFLPNSDTESIFHAAVLSFEQFLIFIAKINFIKQNGCRHFN